EALRGLADPAPFAAVPWEGVPVGLAARADLIVNATPVGQAGEPIDPEGIRPRRLADVVYHPPETRLVLEARGAGSERLRGAGDAGPPGGALVRDMDPPPGPARGNVGGGDGEGCSRGLRPPGPAGCGDVRRLGTSRWADGAR
ncbi:MAG: hypothetical protein ACRDJ4_14230, partial [Actinomycetota bacterium]